MNLAEKLLYIQQNLKAPKNQYNKFGNFKYRSCEDILEAVKPLLAETKTVLLISDDIQVKGDRFYVVATAVLMDTESGETFDNQACAREADDNKAKMDAAQVTGTSSTYARKYALNGLFCIDDSKDPDMAEPEGKGSGQAGNRNQNSGNRQGAAKNSGRTETKPKYVGPDCISKLMAEMRRTGVTEQYLIQQCGIRSLSEITKEQYQDIMYKFSCTASKGQRAAGQSIPVV
ncbi:MAG: ERF family protein [Lachnospiraceae bacterium]